MRHATGHDRPIRGGPGVRYQALAWVVSNGFRRNSPLRFNWRFRGLFPVILRARGTTASAHEDGVRSDRRRSDRIWMKPQFLAGEARSTLRCSHI